MKKILSIVALTAYCAASHASSGPRTFLGTAWKYGKVPTAAIVGYNGAYEIGYRINPSKEDFRQAQIKAMAAKSMESTLQQAMDDSTKKLELLTKIQLANQNLETVLKSKGFEIVEIEVNHKGDKN